MLRPISALLALIAWLTVGTQFVLSIRSSLAAGNSVVHGIVMYFGYFTLLTNILGAAIFSAWARPPLRPALPSAPAEPGLAGFLRSPGVTSTAATAIIIVGAVYHAVLADLWNPQGLDLAVDTMLHTVLPLLFVAFWWRTVPRGAIGWGDIPRWAAYPACYALYVFARGAVIGEYPYPFIDVGQIGYLAALRNAAGIAVVFCALAALLVGVNRIAGASRPPEP